MEYSKQPSTRLANGAAAGLLATVCMSGVMLAGSLLWPKRKLPPRKIVEKGLQAAAASAEDPVINTAAFFAHLGFGTLAGCVFGFVEERSPLSPVVKGVAFGLSVWALSYEGWIPALGIMPPPQRDERCRAVTIAAAHGVYGAVLGIATEALSSP